MFYALAEWRRLDNTLYLRALSTKVIKEYIYK